MQALDSPIGCTTPEPGSESAAGAPSVADASHSEPDDPCPAGVAPDTTEGGTAASVVVDASEQEDVQQQGNPAQELDTQQCGEDSVYVEPEPSWGSVDDPGRACSSPEPDEWPASTPQQAHTSGSIDGTTEARTGASIDLVGGSISQRHVRQQLSRQSLSLNSGADGNRNAGGMEARGLAKPAALQHALPMVVVQDLAVSFRGCVGHLSISVPYMSWYACFLQCKASGMMMEHIAD